MMSAQFLKIYTHATHAQCKLQMHPIRHAYLAANSHALQLHHIKHQARQCSSRHKADCRGLHIEFGKYRWGDRLSGGHLRVFEAFRLERPAHRVLGLSVWAPDDAVYASGVPVTVLSIAGERAAMGRIVHAADRAVRARHARRQLPLDVEFHLVLLVEVVGEVGEDVHPVVVVIHPASDDFTRTRHSRKQEFKLQLLESYSGSDELHMNTAFSCQRK